MKKGEGSRELYLRKLTRSPDFSKFSSYPPKLQTDLSHFRSMMHTVYAKIAALKEELDRRDNDLDMEQGKRKSLEKRMENFVDIYNNKALNTELNERLSKVKPVGLQVSNSSGFSSEKDYDNSDPCFEQPPNSDKSSEPKKAGSNEQRDNPQMPIVMPLSAAYPPSNIWPVPTLVPLVQDFMVCKHCGHSTLCDPKSTQKTSPVSGPTAEEKFPSKEMSRLWLELGKMKDLSEKLQEQLDEVEEQTEKHLDNEGEQSQQGCYIPGDVSRLVENIYRAQRERDESVLERLDNAIRAKDNMLHELVKIPEVPKAENKQTMPPEIHDGQEEKLQEQETYHKKVMAAMEAKEELLQEKTELLLKMKEVENENLDFAHRLLNQEAYWEDSFEREIHRFKELEDQRDVILEHFDELKVELAELQLTNRLLEVQSTSQPELGESVDSVSQTNLSGEELDAELAHARVVQQERNELARQLIEADRRLKISLENQHKLERLVIVLRRKIHTLARQAGE